MKQHRVTWYADGPCSPEWYAAVDHLRDEHADLEVFGGGRTLTIHGERAALDDLAGELVRRFGGRADEPEPCR